MLSFFLVHSSHEGWRTSAASIMQKRTLCPKTVKPNDLCYKSYTEFKERLFKLKFNNWIIKESDEFMCISHSDTIHTIPKYEVYVTSSLAYVVRVFGWRIPDSHEICDSYKSSLNNITLSELIKRIEKQFICNGILHPEAVDLLCFQKHCIPKIYNPLEISGSPLLQTVINRSLECRILIEKESQCRSCKTIEKREEKNLKRKHESQVVPAKLNAPISKTSSERIKATLQSYRVQNNELKSQIEEMKEEIKNSSVQVAEDLSKDLGDLMSGANDEDIPSFMRLFWNEQQNYLRSSEHGIRYHPMIIKFCLGLAAKSSSGYDELRYDSKSNSGILVLPSRRTLRSYKNYIKPRQGFNREVIAELCQKVNGFSAAEKYVCILMDEMKIQENLVWDKHSGHLIGFVDLGDIKLNYACLQKTHKIASHVLVFLIRSIVNPLKFSMANFATTSATSFQIFPLFWKAVGILELQCGLKVVAATCDGASANRKFFKMHRNLSIEKASKGDTIYKVNNWFSDEGRYIYFFSDAPHLLKTARNCLSKSGTGSTTRLLWNSGKHILWRHIADLYYEDLECGLHLLPKLTNAHIQLNSYSVMNVRLAAQVLSTTVSVVLKNFGPPEAQETAELCSLFDTFFDCLNVRNTTEHHFKRKPALMPYTSVDDERFIWLENVFLKYFEDWLNSINDRPGSFSPSDRAQMFISWQTYEGLKITVKSVVELTQYLLAQGIPFILTERFCQDPLENYFGQQRSIGRRKDNPSLRDVGYNDNTIRNQKIFVPIKTGNCMPDDTT